MVGCWWWLCVCCCWGNLSTTPSTHTQRMHGGGGGGGRRQRDRHIHTQIKLCLPSIRVYAPPTWHTGGCGWLPHLPLACLPTHSTPYFHPSTHTHAQQRTLYNKCSSITHSHSHTHTHTLHTHRTTFSRVPLLRVIQDGCR